MKKYRFVGMGIFIGGEWMEVILPLDFKEITTFEGVGIPTSEVSPNSVIMKVPALPTEGPNIIEGFVSCDTEEEGTMVFLGICRNFGKVRDGKLKEQTILDQIEANPPILENLN